MKLQMEFETSDLRAMVKAYFDKGGFRVKNLDAICEQFDTVYPKGIVVNVEMQNTNSEDAPPEDCSEDADNTEEVRPPLQRIVDVASPISESAQYGGYANVALSTDDLLDPTPGVSNVPRRKELLEQQEQEMARILAQSNDLKEEKR